MTAPTTPNGFERLLLQFYGPADVGDVDGPTRQVELVPDICPTCGHDRSTHPVTRDPVLGSVMSCPGPDPT